MSTLYPPNPVTRVPGMRTPRGVIPTGTRTGRRLERQRVRRNRLAVTVTTVATILAVITGAQLGAESASPSPVRPVPTEQPWYLDSGERVIP